MRNSKWMCIGIILSAALCNAQWTPVSDNPEPRKDHSMVTLPDGRVVMFGGLGEDDALFDDTNIFHDTWTFQEAQNAPSGRFGHITAADDAGNVFVACGQKGLSDWTNELFVYENGVWSQRQPDGETPDARAWASGWWHDGGLYVMGGSDGDGDMSDVWTYDPAADAWGRFTHPPTTISGASVGIWNGELFIPGFMADWILVLDLETRSWRDFEPEGDKPESRSFAAHAQHGKDLYLMGGQNHEGDVFSDMWAFDMQSETWTRLDDLPAPLTHASAAVADHTDILLFGGALDDGSLNGQAWLYPLPDTSVPGARLPVRPDMAAAYPNPFNGRLTIEYQMEEGQYPSINVYSITGTHICGLNDKPAEGRIHRVMWNATDAAGRPVSTGVYVIRIDSQSVRQVLKVCYIR